jgi:hypothetical protein
MWRPTPADATARASRLVVIAAAVVFALVVCEGRPWLLFARGGFSADFYDEQARSLLRLRLGVRPDVPGPEGFLIDGTTYLYYGIFLALVRLPFALFGDMFAGRLSRVSMITGYLVFCTGAHHLALELRRWYVAQRRTTDEVPGVGVSWRVVGFVAAAAASPALYLAGWVSVYHETELWAAAFAVWAMVGASRVLDGATGRTAWWTAGALVACTLTRASVGIGVAFGVCLAFAPLAWRIARRIGTVADPTRVWVVAGGAVLGVVGHMAVNVAKFGSPTALPADRQLLTINSAERAAWFAGNNGSFFSTRFLPTTLVQYLRPDTVSFERLIPFVRYGALADDRGSYPMETITASASITAAATLLFVAAVVGVVIAARTKAWRWLALTAGAAVAALPTFTIGFIGNRYLVDMLPMLMVPAALAFVALPVRTPLLRVARIGTAALVVWGLWCNVSLALWTQDLKEPGFTSFRYRVDGWVFGDPAPGLIDLTPGMAVPRDGVVALDRDATLGTCSGVYIAEQGAWVALERTNGARRLTGEVQLTPGATTVAGGETWSIVATVVDDEARWSLDVDGTVTTGDPMPLTVGPAHVTIVADPLTAELSVTVDGTLALFSFAVPPGTLLPTDALVLDGDRGESLCRQLEARR